MFLRLLSVCLSLLTFVCVLLLSLSLSLSLFHSQKLTVRIGRPATSEGHAEGTIATLLDGTNGWQTVPIPGGTSRARSGGWHENVILCVADGSRVTSFELATEVWPPRGQHAGDITEREVTIESIGTDGNPLETLVAWQSCGTSSTGGVRLRHDEQYPPIAYTPQTFPVVTSATSFLISVRHTNSTNTRSAGLAICRIHGSPGPDEERVAAEAVAGAAARAEAAAVADRHGGGSGRPSWHGGGGARGYAALARASHHRRDTKLRRIGGAGRKRGGGGWEHSYY